MDADDGVIIVAPTVLHVGPGSSPLPPWIEAGKETRFDIDARNEPDIVGDMCDMGEIGQFDVVFSCHVLEHVSLSGARKALSEFQRVAKKGGLVIAIVPDLEGIVPDEHVMYESQAGPVTGLDMFYGMQSLVDQFPHMSHRYGYVSETLAREFSGAGLANVLTKRVDGWNLIAFGVKP